MPFDLSLDASTETQSHLSQDTSVAWLQAVHEIPHEILQPLQIKSDALAVALVGRADSTLVLYPQVPLTVACSLMCWPCQLFPSPAINLLDPPFDSRQHFGHMFPRGT